MLGFLQEKPVYTLRINPAKLTRPDQINSPGLHAYFKTYKFIYSNCMYCFDILPILGVTKELSATEEKL